MVDFKKKLKELRAKKAKAAELTATEAAAILAIKGGCDVYAYALAGTLRGIQRRGLPVNQTQGKAKFPGEKKSRHKKFKNALFTITDPMQAPEDGAERQPYFGAMATLAGLKIAHQTLGW